MRFALPRLAALALALASLGLPAQAGDDVRLRFKVAVAGMQALEVTYDASIDETSYRAAAGARIKGIAKLFADFDFAANGEGRVVDGRLLPAKFHLETADEDTRRVLDVSYADDGTITAKRNYELKPGRGEALANAVTPGMPDPLTVLLSVAAQPAETVCQGSYRSYNGAEVVDYVFTRLESGPYKGDADYTGPAVRCRLELKPVAGVSEKRLHKWAKRPPVYSLWFAPAQTTAGKPMHLLIAAEGNAGSQSFKAWASTATLSGKKLAQQ